MEVSFVGLGRMGMPMCANLVRAGYAVTAGDVRPDREMQVTACGARWGGKAAGAAGGADVLITMLPGTQELTEVMLGPDGVLAVLQPGATWIDMTSADPAAGRELAAAADGRGVGVLEAPVGGGVPAAVAGTLQLFVGGDTALLKRHLALLQVLADPVRISHVGGTGTGYTAKLLANLLWFGQAVATAEALLLGRRAGIDLDVLRGVLADSAPASHFITHDLSALFQGDYLASFGLDRCCEELAAVTALAREGEVPFELSEHVERVYRRALDRYGPADGELLPIAMLEEQAGLHLRGGAA